MWKRIRHFLGIYTKAEKFANGYNTVVDAINNKDWCNGNIVIKDK